VAGIAIIDKPLAGIAYWILVKTFECQIESSLNGSHLPARSDPTMSAPELSGNPAQQITDTW
jgi:hypothetical protein